MLKTPVYIIDEKNMIHNLEILQKVEKESGAHILLAQKAFSGFCMYPLISKYISGVTASGLYEARLGFEEFHKENHVFSPAFGDKEMEELTGICDHISFNSLSQLEHHRKYWEKKALEGNLGIGIRVNPELSTQDEHAIYDPCAPGSRLGVRLCDMPDKLPKGVNGLHFHTLCEQGFEPLLKTYREFENKFSKYLSSGDVKWLNLGGGHHITREDYDVEGLIGLIKEIKDKYKVEVYLEPGEAIALDAGDLETTIMDIVQTEVLPVLILDASAACHMPDVLEMPYRPPLDDSGEIGEKKFGYRLYSRTCLAGDVIGDYSFDKELHIGDRLTFKDMAIYSMVKNNTFNGMALPDIAVRYSDGTEKVIKSFGYEDFKNRLS
ncbi:MAG: carboxynorspermidine decarboxylase [Butyrivibrio sp.]|nr:carboxynorspermidine decarboxylase [Butyrivibrio sp.]